MANRLIHIEDLESIAASSPDTNITVNNDEQGNCIPDTGNVAPGEATVNKELGISTGNPRVT
jgi:hypothetical protein